MVSNSDLKPEVLVGCYGWQSTQVDKNFYPEDMPKEWQLDFYANYFRTTLVPEKDWMQWGKNDFVDLLESVELEESENLEIPFQFYFEIVEKNTDNISKKLLQLKLIKKYLGSYCSGIISTSEMTLPLDIVPVGYCSLSDDFGIYLSLDSLSFATVPASYKHPKQQATWAKRLIEELSNAKITSVKNEFMPVFIGFPNNQTSILPNESNTVIEQAKSMKVILEFLGA